MICDIQDIQNTELLNSMEQIGRLLDRICDMYSFSVLGKLQHQFEPQGCSWVYLLSESHISVHTFPEKNYIAMDVYTCREYPNNDVYLEIYDYLVESFQAEVSAPIILDRGKDVSDKDVSERDVSERDVSDKDVSDRGVSNTRMFLS